MSRARLKNIFGENGDSILSSEVIDDVMDEYELERWRGADGGVSIEMRRRTEDRREPGRPGEDTGVVDDNDLGDVSTPGTTPGTSTTTTFSFALFVSLVVSPTAAAFTSPPTTLDDTLLPPCGDDASDEIASLSLVLLSVGTMLTPRHVQTAARRSLTSTYFLCSVSSSSFVK